MKRLGSLSSPPVLHRDDKARPRLAFPPTLTVPTVKIKELKLPHPKISTTCRLAVYHAHCILVSMDSVHNVSRPVVRKSPSATTRRSSNYCLPAPALVCQHLDVLLRTTNNEFPDFGDTKRRRDSRTAESLVIKATIVNVGSLSHQAYKSGYRSKPGSKFFSLD